MSRYDKNKKLYEAVKNNDYAKYNDNILVDGLDLEIKNYRKDFQEKKRLSMYFSDIEEELNLASNKLDEIQTEKGMEIKDDVDLQSLIDQAKKRQFEDGKGFFSNTQHEILSNLDVDLEDEVDLEEIVNDVANITLEEEEKNLDTGEVKTNIDQIIDLDNFLNEDLILDTSIDEDASKRIEDVDIEAIVEEKLANEATQQLEVVNGDEDIEDDEAELLEEEDDKDLEEDYFGDEEYEDDDYFDEEEDNNETNVRNSKLLTVILIIIIVTLIVFGGLLVKTFI